MSEGLIYAFYEGPKSTSQKAYTDSRLAQLAAQRRGEKLPSDTNHIECKWSTSLASTAKSRDRLLGHAGLELGDSMEFLTARTQASVINPTSSIKSIMRSSDNDTLTSTIADHEHKMLCNPFELRHGRRYLRDVPYPLPVDLAEIQRQSLRTMLGVQVFGSVLCNPKLDVDPPKKVLEIGCGSGFWSALAHDHFASRGHAVEFVGLDIAPLASNLKRQGVNWKFVQHDLRRVPLPFDDGEFDLIMLKDLSLLIPVVGQQHDKTLTECIRICRPGGTLECWDSDHVIRSLLPNPPPQPSRNLREQEAAEETATFAIQPGHPFAPAQNNYLQDANIWIAEALDRRKLHPTPCVRIAEMLTMEPDLEDLGFRRVAIPLGELRWEKDAPKAKRIIKGHDSPMSVGSRRAPSHTQFLTPEQAALRQTALLTVVQMIESFEPMLKEASGKSSEEWSLWWGSMMTELLDPTETALTGECLELGAWWATKSLTSDEDDL
ncbi:uncharacterized protein MYCFIDRAFT_89050 [Pseudocercospora fijiensis CIRAD86]|uniref:Methyltransferase domain-containing protein n=1 Tax=Pseudocercospora fijiensis (strain CIRAD86) TaxID=383855 RepID=M3AJG8_PSEFD|nr:uncharacterized protein MYCFIDRAFT_89050 [Pseudocercospora fijiensis CIRAD86]EME77622.1 hypothetical protein MYCFIDRAFT_89050 [Pseudocercospora fijiensis CIRAD86]